MKKEMLINVLQPEECRIAIIEDGVLEELYVERTSHESYTGNIYKGRIVNIEPAIQAAFVDFSVGRNGFLHVSDVEPQYYRKHLADDAELGARDRARDPRRDRDEPRPARPERDEPRPARPEERSGRAPASGPVPPEDRPRERDRDWDRDRPDRSEKGRRDRSSRQFGEGLGNELDEPMPPPRAAQPPPRLEPERRDRDQPPRARADVPAFSWADEPPAPRPAVREPRPSILDEPRGRLERPAELFEADLPPSRTQRGRPEPPPPPEPEDFGRPRSPAAARPFEPEPELPAAEARRGRGRRPARPAESEVPADVEFDATELLAEPAEPAAEDRFEPRRRGGRAAIRSRGADREPQRPREPAAERPREPAAERPREPAAERPWAPEPERPRDLEVERPRSLEPERPRDLEAERPRARGRAAGAEPPPERPKPHGRAGEPGYVPRRERARPPEPAAEAGAIPLDWLEPEVTRPRELDDLELETDVEAEAEAEAEAETETETTESIKAEGARKRRRRRGRRRERPDREPDAAPTAEELEGDLEDEFREEPEPDEEGPLVDDFGFEDDDIEAIEDEEGLVPAGKAPAAPEEEIDPELEEEIRREIEEIRELELEMGLRGPIEARPSRGDARGAEAARPGARAGRGRGLSKPPIQEVFRRGDEVLVQVIKESIGTKGPTLSTYISIPGRYLVLMPGLNRVGVSRKIADEGQRRKLREIMNELNPPKGLGFIVRTAGLDRTKRELAKDLAYLLRLWKVILRRIKKARAPAPIYQESDMITRTIRDIFNSEIDTIWIDEPGAFERAQEFLKVVMPRYVGRLKFYDDKVPLFHKYGLEEEIAKIQRRHVPLPEGGSIVIDQTEALVAIDVNSGNFRVESDAEKTAYEMNLRAAKEIARQLRLRDLGGVIVNDFIDMRDERNRRGVERALREAIKRDRARTKVLRMSAFGIIEMTRQRIRPSLKRSVYEDCSHCKGAGVVKTVESMSIDVMRLLALASHREEIRRVNVVVCPGVAATLNNRKRREIARIEAESNLAITIQAEDDAPAEHLQFDCTDGQNNEVRLLPAPPPPPRRGR